MSRARDHRAYITVLAFLGLAALLAACSGGGSNGATAVGQSVTGFSIAPQFQAFYDEYGGARIFGFPVSTASVDSESGRLVQYFHYLRLEFDQAAEMVTVSPLGEFYAPEPAEQVLAPGPPNGGQRTFPETGYTVQDAFLAFYEANEGELIFGPPITPQLDEAGKLVQYFRNAEMVWNPNAPPEFRVELAFLSEEHYRENRPVSDSFESVNPAALLEADVSATVKEPILYAGEQQILYVTVITPDGLYPVEGATVSVTITYNGLSTATLLPLTDAMGQTQAVLEMPGIEPGDNVLLEVEAVSVVGTPLGKTMLSFRTWW